jgi:hypothetical protein
MRSIAIKHVYNPSLEILLFSTKPPTPLHHQSQSRQRFTSTVSRTDFTTMVSRPAAEGTMPVSASSGVHANDRPLRESQADLGSGLSGIHTNDRPLRESQADLEAGRADQEKASSASTASSPPPPAYFSFVSSHTSAQTQLVAQKPVATSSNVVVEDIERSHVRVNPESAERQHETIRAIVKTAVVEQLAKKEKEEVRDGACCCIFYLNFLLILGIIWLVNKFSS